MKVTVNKRWYEEQLIPASMQWRAGNAREKFVGVVLSLLLVQRESKKTGIKKASSKTVIPVSERMLESIYLFNDSRKKFRRLVLEDFNLIVKDDSWISKSLADKFGYEPRCNTWHITEPDFKGEVIEIDFNPNTCNLYSTYKKKILETEGTKVNSTDEFRGVWAVDAYEKGELSYSDFIEVGKVASNIQKGKVIGKEPSCRVFDAVSLCKKTLREKCFVNSSTGVGMKEVYDISGAISITAPLALAVLNKGDYDDSNLYAWALNQSQGKKFDPYEKIFKSMLELDSRDPYKSNREWNSSVRKTLKMDVQCVLNSDEEYMTRSKLVHDKKIKVNSKEYFRLSRQYLVFEAIKQVNKSLALGAEECRKNGIKGNFYRLHTLGEKVIIDTIVKVFKSNGATVHRVHDAIWTTDGRLVSASENQVKMMIGMIFINFLEKKMDYNDSKKNIKKLSASVSQRTLDWVKEGLK